jgi:hypothetical protein
MFYAHGPCRWLLGDFFLLGGGAASDPVGVGGIMWVTGFEAPGCACLGWMVCDGR